MMDLSHPEYAVLGESRARVLRRLAALAEPISGRRIHELSGVRTLRTTQRILDDLVAMGLVGMQKVGAAHAYTLNRDHVLWNPIEHVLALRVVTLAAVEDVVSRGVADDVVSAAIYGSVARGEAGPDSDIDVLIVWKDHAPVERRDAILDALEKQLRSLTGNQVQLLAVSTTELPRLVTHEDPLVESILKDGRTVTGVDLASLLRHPEYGL